VKNGIHFIAGLPRAGSTLLAALLSQNPAVHAGMTSPVGSLVGALLADMSQGNETSVFIDDTQREAILKSVVEGYYHAIHPSHTVFDTNRGWTARLELIDRLFPDAKVICCVRHVPWIMDSVERLIRANPFELSRIFAFDRNGTVYSRAEGMMSSTGMIGYALNSLKQGMHGPHAGRLLLLPYDTLTRHPKAAMNAIYDFTGLPPFEHDFDNVEFDAEEFDARLGTPGLHRVARQVTHIERESILPPDLWQRYEGASIWRDPDFNRQNVPIP
jgi:sulfotransferase